ncbi:MAG TPA: MerR family transcriptional regulator [Candidatus Ruania gallistercoris]|uniref:MerR family transcriptional regulator n=1 Tax=Candidatus Ruania gallistercoris TaxID=2838746 RepID=A0A9D2ECX6_9MICO|nr:MerR family transcriptional regulator [Candidatus Ruania gallistercoris]
MTREQEALTGRQTWKIGDLARATGLTVRTLHHWDDLGLVAPAREAFSGHRYYTGADVERVYQVLALRRLGVALDTIGAVLADAVPLEVVLSRHLAAVQSQLTELTRLRASLQATLTAAEDRTSADLLTLIRKVIVVDKTVEKYFTPDQLAELAQRQESEAEQIAQVQHAWPDLIARVQNAVENGVDPTSEEGRALGKEWQDLLAQFHRGDEQLRDSLYTMQAENAEQIQREHGGPSPEQLEFIARATA